MKRLKLEAFKAKKNTTTPTEANQLLGQVLGNCHDKPSSGSSNGGGYNVGDMDSGN